MNSGEQRLSRRDWRSAPRVMIVVVIGGLPTFHHRRLTVDAGLLP